MKRSNKTIMSHSPEKLKSKNCEICGALFSARKVNAKYCPECKDKIRQRVQAKYRFAHRHSAD